MLPILTHWLTGEFNNRAQSLENPAWFVHLRLWHRPVAHLVEDGAALFAEQANAIYLDQPYRQRILLLRETTNPTVVAGQYLAFKQPDRFRGAGRSPNLLSALSLDDLEFLPGCTLTVTQKGDRFTAQPDPDAKCCFQYDGKTRQVVLGWEVGDGSFLSYDRGIDPETGQSLWGATMGAYEFHKTQQF